MNKIENVYGLAAGVLGGFITTVFGGWTQGIQILLIMMLIDMISGITSAVLCKSTKTKTGALNSYITWKGICKKLATLLMVGMAYQLDLALNTTIIRDATVIFFVFNEGTSIIENMGNIGVPLPSVIKKALDLLKEKSDSETP